jgi:hypothetical protein
MLPEPEPEVKLMMRFPSGRRIVALASILTVALAADSCRYNESGNHQGQHHGHWGGNGGGKGTCYEKVLDIDKKTGQTHYVNRAVPCPK